MLCCVRFYPKISEKDRLRLAKYRKERKGKGEKVVAKLSIINFGSCDT